LIENKQFVSLLKKHQASISDNLVYADKASHGSYFVTRSDPFTVSRREGRFGCIKSTGYRDSLCKYSIDIRVVLTCSLKEAEQCRRDLADVRVKERQVLQSFYEQREQDIGQFRMALESRDREKDEMKAQIELTKKQAEDERFKWSQEIQARDDNLAKKQKEIDDLKKEVIKNNQQHEQQLQRLRTKVADADLEQLASLTNVVFVVRGADASVDSNRKKVVAAGASSMP
jgi:septal ring factor EnvC (AmiA/AmiB activator)